MTRKSLAVGLSGLLVSVTLGALPASAAAALTLTDKNETGKYTMIGGETFTLTGSGNADFVGDAKKLRYKITNVDGVALGASPTITLDGGASDLVDGANQALKADGSGTDSALGAAAGDTAVFALAADDAGVDVAADGASIMTSPSSISFTASPADNTTASYKVDFFYDADNDGVLDAGELSATQTVTFIHSSDVTAQITIAAMTEGDTTVSGTLNFANIDGGQLTLNKVGVYIADGQGNELGDDGADATVALDVNGAAATFTYDATDKRFEWATAAQNAVDGLDDALVKAVQIDVKATFLAGGNPVKANAVGAATSALVVARTVGSITADTVVSTTAAAAAAGTANVALNSTYQVAATVKDTATTPAVMAGQAVTAKITVAGAALAAAPEVSVTVNGTKYTSAAALPGAAGVAELALTTNSDGQAIVTITTKGFADTDDVVVTFTTENRTAAVTTNNATLTYTVTHGAFTTTTDGTGVSVPVVVYDQFGGVPANDYDVRAVFDVTNGNYAAQATTASTAATSTNVALVGGKATVSVTDNGTGVGVNSYDITVEARAAGGGFGAALTGTGTTVLDVHIKTAASLVAGTVTSNGAQDATTKVYKIAGPVALSLVDYKSYDSTNVIDTAPVAYTNALTAQNVTGTVSTAAAANAAAVAVPGASVTVSGENLLFGNGSGKFVPGSITVQAGTNGVYSVNVYSHFAGAQTLTVSSGAATATVEITFAAAAVGTVANVAIDASDYSPAGSTVIAKAVATDKYGNPVAIADGAASDFELTYDGPGLAVTARADATNASGEAKVAYFLGSNDTGTITITAKYDVNDDGDYLDTGDLVVTKTITIGDAPAPVADTKVNAGSFKGYVAIYAKGHEGKRLSAKVGNDWVVVPALASNFVRVVEYTGAGYTISVRIYIDRVLVDTIVVTTK